MRTESLKEHRPTDKQLWHACSALWVSHVKEDLAHGENLLLCRSCISFFYPREDHDHPTEHVVSTQQYFLSHDVTSLAKFVEFFSPFTKIADLGQSDPSLPTLPEISHIHRRPHSTGLAVSPQQCLPQVAYLCRDNTALLCQEIDSQKMLIARLQCEIRALRSDNEDLLIKIAKNNAKVEVQRRSIYHLANHIMVHCDEEWRCDALKEEDCRCQEEEDKCK